MKVYLLEIWEPIADNENYVAYGIFSTKEIAEEEFKKSKRNVGLITEFVVDGLNILDYGGSMRHWHVGEDADG